MRIEPIHVTAFVIHDAPKLDPIRVFVRDMELGRGAITIECCDRAFCASWRAMGNNTVRQFVIGCDADYIAQCLARSLPKRMTPSDEAYLTRIVEAVQAALREASHIHMGEPA